MPLGAVGSHLGRCETLASQVRARTLEGGQPGHSDRTVLLAQHILDVSAVAAQVHLSVEREGTRAARGERSGFWWASDRHLGIGVAWALLSSAKRSPPGSRRLRPRRRGPPRCGDAERPLSAPGRTLSQPACLIRLAVAHMHMHHESPELGAAMIRSDHLEGQRCELGQLWLGSSDTPQPLPPCRPRTLTWQARLECLAQPGACRAGPRRPGQ